VAIKNGPFWNNSVRSGGNAPALTEKRHVFILNFEDGNTAFILCLKIEAAVFFEMRVNFY
jgi:hypothetical protein